MSVGEPTRSELPPDTRPSAVLLAGLRRGLVLVFLPVFFAGQALAWLAYAASGWYGPWSWVKIGLAETLASVRVSFVSAGLDPEEAASLQVAIGAFTIAVLVLAFRAGRQQARGLERRPAAAMLAGAAVGLGFALPMFVVAFPITLGFPQFGIHRLEPVLLQAFALPLLVGATTGAVGGAAAAGDTLTDRGQWTQRAVAAMRGGALGLWWAVVLSFLGFLVLAAISPGPTGAYARFVSRDKGGAVMVVMHASLLPNQSVLFFAGAMGGTTTLSVGGVPAVEITRGGVDAPGELGSFLAAYAGARGTQATFPPWFALVLVIPAGATLLGGRAAARGAAGRGERAVRGALAGLVFAAACVVAAWASTLVVPAWTGLVGGSVQLGPSLRAVFALGVAWGVVGCTLGAAALPRPATSPR